VPVRPVRRAAPRRIAHERGPLARSPLGRGVLLLRAHLDVPPLDVQRVHQRPVRIVGVSRQVERPALVPDADRVRVGGVVRRRAGLALSLTSTWNRLVAADAVRDPGLPVHGLHRALAGETSPAAGLGPAPAVVEVQRVHHVALDDPVVRPHPARGSGDDRAEIRGETEDVEAGFPAPCPSSGTSR